MFDFFSKLLDGSDFPARWTCGLWTSGHGWLHIVSDIAIFGAYMAIPIVLSVLLTRRADIPFPRVFWLFVAFIAFCGIGHLVEAMIFWQPLYRLSGLIKLGTATASWATVIALVPTVQTALTFTAPEDLERVVAERTAEIREQKALLEAILSSLSAGIVVADRDGELTLFNDAASRILGLNLPSDLPTSEWSEYYGVFLMDGATPCPESELPLVQIIRGTADRVDADLIIRNANFEDDRVISVSARPVVGSSGPARGVASFTDITKRVAAERELHRSNQDLEQFAYATSHDLREPLRNVSGYAQLLAEECGDQLDAEARTYLRFVTEGTTRMQSLLDGLLAYSRIGTGAGSRGELVDVAAVLDLVLEDLSTLIDDQAAVVRVAELPAVHAEPTQLRQLFQNLLANALKFRSGAPPEVDIAVTTTPASYQFSVRDNGIGIKPEHQDRIFGVFQRLHTRKEYPGNGIGLALCHKIVTRHGGRIWVESDAGAGSTFHFTLPRRAPGRGTSGAPSSVVGGDD